MSKMLMPATELAARGAAGLPKPEDMVPTT